MSPDVIYSQHSYRCRLDWGRRAAREAAARGDSLVIVDVLRFSTAVAAAIHRGGVIIPCSEDEDAERLAERLGAEVADYRMGMAGRSRYSLSPCSFEAIASGTRVVLRSPNGATCARYGGTVPHLLVGALVNASAVGRAVSRLVQAADRSVTVVACGERWKEAAEDGALRVAIEDYLGAGAILAAISAEKSPEAEVCEAAFRGCADRLAEILWECASGRELRAKGLEEDVRLAARRDLYDSVPTLRGEQLIRLE
jgi:2-phosphosulfolactate phosphatase